MTKGGPSTRGGFDAVRDSLAGLLAIEIRIQDSLDDWGDAVRDHPEASGMIGRMRNSTGSHREALERTLDATAPSRPEPAERLGAGKAPRSAAGALRLAAEAALDAALVCEAAYQTARLSYDGDTCDLLEAHLADLAAIVADVRRVLPHVVARELRRDGVVCVCRCPSCSIGACGCVRATLATAELAWTGQEPGRAASLALLTPPRPGSQLAAAGLVEGDRILAVDGAEVGSNREMQAALRRHEVGEEARLNVKHRGGEITEVIVRRVG